MTRAGAFIISAAVAFAVAAVALASCARTPTLQSQSPSPVPSVATTKKKDEIRVVTFEKPRLKFFLSEWWPTEVINIMEVEKGPQKGSWIIEIRNVSDKPIKSVLMDLSPPYDCPEFVMSGGWIVGLGADKPYLTKPAKPTLDPGETDKVVVGRDYVSEIIPARELRSCPPEQSYCYLRLEEVIYADGTEWERNHEGDPNWKDN